MENKQKFNRELFTTIVLQKFLKNYRHSKQEALRKQAELKKLREQNKDSTTVEDYPIQIKVEDAYRSLLNVNNNHPEKIQILENCKKLFESDSTQKEVDLEIATIRTEITATKGREPSDSEIAKWLIKCFSEELFDTNKRTYDMSQVASKDMISTVKTPQGKVLKQVAYISFEEQQKRRAKSNPNAQPQKKVEPPKIVLKDRHKNPIHIEFMGCLAYKTFLSQEYIYKFHITQTIDGVITEHEVFSNMDIFEMKYDKELCNVIVSELLSKKNITLSNVDGYIGEIHKQSSTSMKPGNEKLERGGMYTYQISPKYALIYNGERIEAIRAYNQQEAMKKSSTQPAITDSRKNTDDELEI